MHNIPYEYIQAEVYAREAGFRKAQLNGRVYEPRRRNSHWWQRQRPDRGVLSLRPDRECC